MTQSAAAGSLRERMAVAFDTVEEHEFEVGRPWC